VLTSNYAWEHNPFMDKRTRFETLQTAARLTSTTRDTYRNGLTARYSNHAYAKAVERKKLDQLDRAEKRAFYRFTAFLASVSPRSWESGVPCAWLRDSLTFDDAITRAALSVVPPAAWGHDARDLQRFAAALPEAA
jgi:hypothetical protein